MRRYSRTSFVFLAALAVAGCASSGGNYVESRETVARGVEIETLSQPLQCVPFARARSGVAIHGDAWSWWDQAAALYRRGHAPEPGAVMVFARGDGGTPLGHVAVVTQIESGREIRVDHANWLGDGRVYRSDPVRDVSPGNDWSKVVVWNPQTSGWGIHRYPVSGFILPQPVATAMATSAPR